MIKNYIKIAWRNLVKQRLYSFITISGLAVGLAVCIMIMMYVAHEMSYDRFHKNADRIFTAHYIARTGDNFTIDWVKYNSGEELKKTQPTVEDYVGVRKYQKEFIVGTPNSLHPKFAEDNLLFAGEEFFKFFSFKLLSGNVDDVLKNPFSVVISRNMAQKYFGHDNPVGKTIIIKTDSAYTYQVTGVAENNPSNSSINFDFAASGLSMKEMKEFGSLNGPGSTYLRLKHIADTTALRSGVQLNIKKADNTTFSLIPLTDMHLKGSFNGPTKDSYIKIFPFVAILILLLALVNHMSLAIARATTRAKEIGVRKVAGASRKSIAMQFYIESALIAFLAFIVGLVLFCLFKPWFLNVLQLKIDDTFLYGPQALTLLFALLTATALIAGSYPALVLSAFKPVSTLKGKLTKNAGGIIVRKVFTTLQFTIAIALIICGLTIDRQLHFFRHADTGLNRENVLMIPAAKSFGKNYLSFNHDIRSLAGVSQVAASRRSIFNNSYNLLMLDDKTTGQSTFVPLFMINDGLIPVLNLKWKIKPNTKYGTTANEILINEEAINKLHLNPNPVGALLRSGGETYTIAGVLKNFNFLSLANNINPLSIIVKPDTAAAWNKDGFNLYVKIKAHTNLPSLINDIKKRYNKYDAETPFSCSFMDDDFNAQYKAEDRLASIFSLFTCIAIILATLGLFGLAAFTIEQRIKEIGIRKVLGASTTSINTLLSADFLKLVLMSIIIASPVAWWAMHKWLQNFAYRITIPWWVFILAAAIAIITSYITVSYSAIKAALTNPVKSLRSE